MAAIVEKLRAQCRIDTDDATDDELLMLYFRAACRKAENFINRKLYEETVPEGDPEGVLIADDVLLALMLLVGHWYENRENSSDVSKAPVRLVFLLCWSLIVLFLCRRRHAGGQIT